MGYDSNPLTETQSSRDGIFAQTLYDQYLEIYYNMSQFWYETPNFFVAYIDEIVFIGVKTSFMFASKETRKTLSVNPCQQELIFYNVARPIECSVKIHTRKNLKRIEISQNICVLVTSYLYSFVLFNFVLFWSLRISVFWINLNPWPTKHPAPLCFWQYQATQGTVSTLMDS